MTDPVELLDYGEALVLRYPTSGQTRKIFAAAGVPVRTLNDSIRRVNRERDARLR